MPQDSNDQMSIAVWNVPAQPASGKCGDSPSVELMDEARANKHKAGKGIITERLNGVECLLKQFDYRAYPFSES